MKDTFQLRDSFGILSLLFSNKEKYKDHPVLKQIEELSTKPLYVVYNSEALTKCVRNGHPIPVVSIQAVANSITQSENNTFIIEVTPSEGLMPNTLYETVNPVIMPLYITNIPSLKEGDKLQEDDLDLVISLAGFFLAEKPN
jgi:hypothetical protein|nr:MAG TPA: hypothetical protein [Caudoviricetes sp.]